MARETRAAVTRCMTAARANVLLYGFGVVEDGNGWTIRTRDGSLSAHHEHTLLITKEHPVVLTAA